MTFWCDPRALSKARASAQPALELEQGSSSLPASRAVPEVLVQGSEPESASEGSVARSPGSGSSPSCCTRSQTPSSISGDSSPLVERWPGPRGSSWGPGEAVGSGGASERGGAEAQQRGSETFIPTITTGSAMQGAASDKMADGREGGGVRLEVKRIILAHARDCRAELRVNVCGVPGPSHAKLGLCA